MAKKSFLFALLFVALFKSVWAFDFYAVCSTGQTLYYNITDASNHYVETTHPGVDSEPWTGYSKPTGSMTIPSTVSHNGVSYSVKSIGSNSFIECTGITSVIISSGITTVQAEAFYGCSGMNSIDIGNSVTTIGGDSFGQCTNLSSVNLGSSLSSIGGWAFFHCTGLTSISFPNSLTTIGSSAFVESGLTSLNLPSSVISVGESAFYHTPWYNNQPDGVVYAGLVACSYKGTMPSNTSIAIQSGTKSLATGLFKEKSGLISVSLPNSLMVIGENAFWGCPGLTSITIPASVTYIGAKAFFQCGNLQTVNYNAQNCTYMGQSVAPVFSGCASFNTLNIGNGVVSIPEYAFYGCSELVNVSMPNSVTTINKYAFYGCSSLSSITIPNSVTTINDCAFYGCSSLSSITIPNSVTTINNSAFSDCSNMTSVTIGSAVSLIGNNAFGGCSSLTTINYNATNCGNVSSSPFPGTSPALTTLNIGNTVQSIPACMFSGCSHINVVSIPNSVHTIGQAAFYYCTGMSSLSIGNTVTSIGNEAFSSCSGLSSLSIGNSVTSIGNEAFWGCSSISAIIIPNSVTSIGERAFYNCSGATSLSIGNSVQTIPEYAFYGCSNISSLSIGSSVSSIESYAFSGCSSISSINIPNSVTSLGSYVFYICSGATSLSIGNSVQTIPESAFWGCSGLSSVTIPNSVVAIGDNAFRACSGITTLQFGNAVTSIGSGAFMQCSSLASLSIGNAVTSIGEGAFWYCTGLTSVTIPASVTNMATDAFFGCSAIATVNYNAINCTNTETNPFFSGSSITSFHIGNGVVSIPRALVINCPNLTGQLIIPNTVTSIGGLAFSYCGISNKLTIPSSVSSIANTAFAYCTGLTEIEVLSQTPPSCGATTFAGCYDKPLIVPCGCVSAYQNSPGWSNFTNIQQASGCSYQINASANPSNGGTVQGAGIYNQGQSCSLVASANTGFSFVNWTENGSQVSTSPTYSFSVTGDRTLVANFQYQQPSTFTITATANPANGGTISGTGTYSQGETCTLSASPSSGYVFLRWTENGTQVSTNPTYSFTVNGNRTLVANFQYNPPTYTISASANPTNGGSVSGAGTFTEGQVCTLTASANSGFVFLKWTENGTQVSTNPTYSFTVNSNRTLVAHFQSQPNQYTITVSADPSNGGSVSGGGTYQQGQQCTVIATANSNYTFIKWTENGTQVSTNPTYSFTVNSNRTLVAHFQNQPSQYTITLSANPTNGGAVSGGGTYSQGQTCTVTANANPNYSFVNWTENGTQVSTNSTYSFAVTGNRTLVANFSYSPTGYVINATAEPSYGGLVSGGGTYNQGQTCTLIATPNPNYDFVNWTEGGNVVSTNASYSFTVNGNRTLVAHFESQVFTVTANAEPSEGGTVYGSGTYSGGITCHLIAVPNSNYNFMNWTENGIVVSSDPDYSFVVTGDRTLVANFFNYDAVEELDNNIMVYPNPTKDVVFLKGCNIRKVELYDLTGQMLVSKESLGTETSISIKHLSSGLYLLRVYADNDIVIVRVSKE